MTVTAFVILHRLAQTTYFSAIITSHSHVVECSFVRGLSLEVVLHDCGHLTAFLVEPANGIHHDVKTFLRFTTKACVVNITLIRSIRR
ncbi:hypothetical protein D3C86_1533970 [compost metagenome]